MATFVILAIFIALTSVAHGTNPRKLTTILNPDCDRPECSQQTKNTSSYNLVYTRAEGAKDSIHYIWSTIGAPSLLIFQTTISSKLSINWDHVFNSTSGAFNFTEPPFYASALIISRIIEFNDPSDNGNANWNSSDFLRINLDELKWDMANDSLVSSPSHAQIGVNTLRYDNEKIGNGVVNLQFDVTGLEEEHDSIIPKLLRNSNSSQIKVKLTNFPINYNNSRYGIEVILITSEKAIGKWKINEQDTLNDEYTPGVFKAVQISSVESQLGFGTYLTWKPVAYTSQELTVTDSTSVNLNTFQKDPTDNISSIANSYFRDGYSEEIQKFNVTFGSAKDGFYNKYKHLSWSFVYGLGVPTNETFSILVIMTVAFGSGIPILLMSASFIYICYLKRKRKQHDN